MDMFKPDPEIESLLGSCTDETRDWEQMDPAERLLWESIDDAIFGAHTTNQERRRMLTRTQLVEPGDLGLKLQELRRQVGLTPTQAAARARVDSSKWCNWEGNAEIRGFGAFSLNTISAHSTVDPNTNEKREIPETYTVDFRPSRLYKERIKKDQAKKKKPKRRKASKKSK